MISQAAIRKARILIVDDLPANVLLVEQMLAGAGYSAVTSTMDPKVVCALHRKNRYDLILLDLLMPGMDGFEVMEGLKSIEAGGYLPVLVVTAQPDHQVRALQAGARDFVSKPFDLVELKTRIYNMLEVRLLYQQIDAHNELLEQTVLERTTELRIGKERFRRLTQLSSDWYWEQDANGSFTEVSGPALEMLGIGPDTGEVRWNGAERAALEQNIAARQPFADHVYSRTRDDGSLQYFRSSGEPIFDPSGCYMGYRGVGMDITAHVRSARSGVSAA